MEKRNSLTSVLVQEIKGVGPAIAGLLAKKRVKTVEDLFYFLPIRYEDRRSILEIGSVKEEEKVVIQGEVVSSRSLYFRRGRRKGYEAIICDGTGTLTAKWFRGAAEYLKGLCRRGNRLLLSGRATRYGNQLQILHPEATVLHEEDEEEDRLAILPVYSEMGSIKQGTIRKLMASAFADYGVYVRSAIPAVLERQYGLAPLYQALWRSHFPDEMAAESERSGHLARLIVEEYFLFQLTLRAIQGEKKRQEGIAFRVDGSHRKGFQRGLPFSLTAAQERVVREIGADMARPEPMNRLLQGDVGSGKTICAVLAACIAVDNGYQAAFMAPTEILAEQHFLTIHTFFETMGIPVVFLRGQMGAPGTIIADKIRSGAASIVVGTHALIQEHVRFCRLGLVVVDEQHRFGVIQRKAIRGKGANPDTLVMTATPIPRTLSMVVYGDLDVSVIDELPQGRAKVRTRIWSDTDRSVVYDLIRGQLGRGHQVYVVYPLIEESEKVDLLSAKRMALHLQEVVFPGHTIGLLHGKMKVEEKERVMGAFKNGGIHVLVCTTVVEVGIHVPNATVVVIEHAERFGLSQLHQLRGRVGRGEEPSHCFLLTSGKITDKAARRLKIMEKTQDGFVIAEEDMRIRGPGDMLGARQSGVPEFRVGDIARDGDRMAQARRIAEQAMDMLDPEELQRLMTIAEARWKECLKLYGVA
jgi:ATP-dependent DNA helicase RecG